MLEKFVEYLNDFNTFYKIIRNKQYDVIMNT